MKKTLSTHEAADSLCQDEYANWSRAGAFALVKWLEELEADTGEEIEFCPVAIRCDFSEHKSLGQWAGEYFSDIKQASDSLGLEIDMSGVEFEEDEEEIAEAIREFIQNNGTLIEFDGGIIVSSF